MSELKHRLKEIADYSLMYGEGDDVRLAIDTIDGLQARVKELEAQRDEMLNQFRILSDDFNSGEYNQYECAFAISDLIAKIEAERKA